MPFCNVEIIILYAIKSLGGESYSLEINREIDKIRGRVMSFPVMNSALCGMENDGILVSRQHKDPKEHYIRTYYKITEVGLAQLEREHEQRQRNPYPWKKEDL